MLTINSITLNNFGINVGKRVFKFNSGLNLINGENGTGKSTCIQAIKMLLLDDFDGNYESFINDGCTFMEARINFTLDDKKYSTYLKSTRSSDGSVSTERKLEREGEPIASTNTDVKKTLATLFDVSSTKYAINYAQNGDNKITKMADADRRELLKKYMNADFSNLVKTKIQPAIDSLKEKVTEIDKQIYAIEHTEIVDTEIKELPFDETEYNKIKKEAEQIKADIALVEEIIKANEKAETRKATLTADVERLTIGNTTTEASICNLENELKILPGVKDKTISDYEQEMVKKEESLKKDLENTLEQFHKDLEEAEKELATIQAETIPVPMRIKRFDEQLLINARTEYTNIFAKVKNLKDSISKLESGVCPVCGGSCTHKVEEYKSELATAEKELSDVEAKSKELAEEQKAYNDNVKAQAEIQGLRAAHESKLQAAELKVTRFERDIELVTNNYQKDYEKNRATFEDRKKFTEENFAKEIEGKQALVVEKKNSLKDSKDLLEAKLKELSEIVIKKVPTTDGEAILKDLETKISNYEEIVAHNKLATEQNAKNVEIRKENEIKAKELSELRSKYVTDQAEWSTVSENYEKKLPLWIVKYYSTTLSNKMNNYVEKLYYKPLNLSMDVKKNSLKLLYGKEDRKLPTTRLSGAEGCIADLSFLLVWNKLLGLDFLCLDEADALFDDKRKACYLEMISNLTDVLGQVLIVTHSAGVKEKVRQLGGNIINL